MNKVKGDTLARTACLALALANQVLAVQGREVLPFGEDQIYQLVTLLFTMVAAVIGWWKNNSFTKAALAGDRVKEEEKKRSKEER